MRLAENPYVGPAAFTEGDKSRFFGRAEETRELASLVVARRAVLLYAQSGSGKTSLLQASLVPDLKRRRRINTFPIARVVGTASLRDKNLYVQNALQNLFPDGTPGTTLCEAFTVSLAENTEPQRRPCLVVFDQFEEIFTFHPELTDLRREFFKQLADCIDANPQLSLLLSMREDYLADLEVYAGMLPDRMRSRMRLERLGVQSALAAISEPAANAGMPFAAGAAESLVDNLRRVRTGAAGKHEVALGQYVEPVQLQIVCRQLWSGLQADTGRTSIEIDASEVSRFANVDDALTRFYRDALAKAQEAGVTERFLRKWFGEKLITSAGTRGLVYRGEHDTAGLANEAVDILRDCYIIRADIRGGDTWYELAHDRLVDPVRNDNFRWKAANRNPITEAHERDPGTLLTGLALAEAIRFAKRNPTALTKDEQAFLENSRKAEAQSRWRRQAVLIGAATTMLGLLIVVALMRESAIERADAEANRLLFAAQIQAGADNDLALLLGVEGARTNKLPAFEPLLRRALSVRGQSLRILRDPAQKQERVTDAVWSSDGKHVISTSFDQRALRLWDVATGRVETSCGVNAHVAFAAWNPDGKHVLAGGNWAATSLWTIAGGTCTSADIASSRSGGPRAPPYWFVSRAAWRTDGMLLTTSRDGVVAIVGLSGATPPRILNKGFADNDAAWSPDGTRVATAGRDNVARIRNAETGAVLAELRGHFKPVNSVSWSKDGTRIVTTSDDWTARIWDVTGRQLQLLAGHTAAVLSADWNGDGNYVVTAGQDRTAIVWNSQNGRQRASLFGHKGPIKRASWSPDSRFILTASFDGTIRIWDPEQQDFVYGGLMGSTLAAWNADGTRIATAGGDGEDGRLIIWDATSVSDKVLHFIDAHPPAPGLTKSLGGGVLSLAWSPDGTRILTTGRDGKAIVWDAASAQKLLELDRRAGPVNSAAWSPDGMRIATAGDNPDHTVRLWSSQGEPAKLPPLQAAGTIFMVAWDPSGTRIVTASTGRAPFAQIWDADTGKHIDLVGHHDFVWLAAWSPDGKRVLTASNDSTAGIWDAATGQLIKTLQHTQAVHYAAWSPDGARVATVSEDTDARIWDPASDSPDPLVVLEGHGAEARYVSWSADGKYVVTAANDDTARVWDAATGAEVSVLSGHTDAVLSADFNKAGSRVLTAAHDGSVRVHLLRLDELIDAACRRTSREMTPGEWKRYMRPTPYRETCGGQH
jgi:WD40 repeat protein